MLICLCKNHCGFAFILLTFLPGNAVFKENLNMYASYLFFIYSLFLFFDQAPSLTP